MVARTLSDFWCTGHKAGMWCCRNSRCCCSFCTFRIGLFWKMERLLGWFDSLVVVVIIPIRQYLSESFCSQVRCPKTRLSALKSLLFFRLSDTYCSSCLTLHQVLQDTGTLRTGVFFLLDINHWKGLAACRLWANFSNSTETTTVFVILQCFFREVFDNVYSQLSLSFGFGAVW